MRHHLVVRLEADTVVTHHRAQVIAWLSALADIHRTRGRPPGWNFDGVEDLVLTHGRWGTPAPLPSGRARGPAGTCYANAQAYSTRHGLTYVEGYGLSSGELVYAHAWCVDDTGNVHDPTWPPGTGLAYLGLPFTTRYIKAFTKRLGDACLLHEPHLDDHRLLRTGPPADAIVPIGEPATRTPAHTIIAAETTTAEDTRSHT